MFVSSPPPILSCGCLLAQRAEKTLQQSLGLGILHCFCFVSHVCLRSGEEKQRDAVAQRWKSYGLSRTKWLRDAKRQVRGLEAWRAIRHMF